MVVNHPAVMVTPEPFFALLLRLTALHPVRPA
jgi:hypothetical protein